MDNLVFVTSNKNKAKEAETILGIPIEIASLELDEIQSLDVEKILTKKAEAAFSLIRKPLIVDDVSLFITTWNGFPGPFLKYIITTGNDLLLRMLQSETDRRCKVVCGVGYHDGEKVHTFLGEIPGEIALHPKGEGGWGIDPIFIMEKTGKTFSEMGSEKNNVSHRATALRKLKDFLKD